MHIIHKKAMNYLRGYAIIYIRKQQGLNYDPFPQFAVLYLSDEAAEISLRFVGYTAFSVR